MSMPGWGPIDDGPWAECAGCGATIRPDPDAVDDEWGFVADQYCDECVYAAFAAEDETDESEQPAMTSNEPGNERTASGVCEDNHHSYCTGYLEGQQTQQCACGCHYSNDWQPHTPGNEQTAFQVGDRVGWEYRPSDGDIGSCRYGTVIMVAAPPELHGDHDIIVRDDDGMGWSLHADGLTLISRPAPAKASEPATPAPRTTISQRIHTCRAALENAHDQIDGRFGGGTVADASLLIVLSTLTDVVEQIAEHLEWCEGAINW